MCFWEACRKNSRERFREMETHTEAAFGIACWGKGQSVCWCVGGVPLVNEGEGESDGQGKAEIADGMLMDGLTFVLLG